MIDITDTRIPLAVRERAAKAVPRPRINNSQALKDAGVKIVHIRSDRFGFPVDRPMTIAFQQINKSHYKIATAVCHKSDTFARKQGTATAIANFNKGNTIVVPVSKHTGPTGQFKFMFSNI